MSEQSEPAADDMEAPEPAPLDEQDQGELLRIARIAVKQWLLSGTLPPGKPHRATLLQPASVFVTIHVEGSLRGCIGRLEADLPLYRAVMELAVSAATRDPRFLPLRAEEAREARFELSVLSPSRRVAGAEAIAVGTHGLVVTRGHRRGLLLPQVAVEHRWDRETFLAETCRKAGLPPEAWREDDTLVESFTAQVFGER